MNPCKIKNVQWRDKLGSHLVLWEIPLKTSLNCRTRIGYHEIGGPVHNVINVQLRAQLENVVQDGVL